MSTTYRDRDFGGDGTVPRVSGSPIELGDDPADAVYVGTKHGSFQNASRTRSPSCNMSRAYYPASICRWENFAARRSQ
jgi:hypothetical protein